MILKNLEWNNSQLLSSISSEITAKDEFLISKYRSIASENSFSTKNEKYFHRDWSVISDDSKTIFSCRRSESVVLTDMSIVLDTLKYSGCLNGSFWSTGYIASKKKYNYGFFEARIKIADIQGLNNAFWLLTADGYEIDIAEIHYPNNLHITLHKWDAGTDHAYGRNLYFKEDFSKSFHDFGLLWLPNRMIFEVDGKPVVAFDISEKILGSAEIRFSTALTPFAGKISSNSEGRKMEVSSIKVIKLQ